MPSSKRRWALGFAAGLVGASALPSRAVAQQKPEGFAVERLVPSAPGGGWFVMDDLSMHGGLGGAIAVTTSYSRDALRVTDGAQRLAVVSDKAFTDFGFAATYDRWRVYLDLDAPLLTKGQSGTVGGYQFSAQSLDLGSNPDTLSDARVGVDGRLVGEVKGPFRLGASAQLMIPNSNRFYLDLNNNYHAAYDTDGTYRAMGRVLVAGDAGMFTYAGQLGVHVRPLDDSPTPGSPQGSELLFGAAAGARIPLRIWTRQEIIVGPEVYGATAFRSFLGSTSTALEGLLTGRLEGASDYGPQVRLKLGAGGGISQHFGAPEWRAVFAVEVLDLGTHREKLTEACPRPE